MTEVKRRGGPRRLMLLGALAAFAVALFAFAPAANAGLAGSNQLTVNISGTGPGQVVQSSGPGNGTPSAINCTKATAGGAATGVCFENIPFGAPPEPFVGLSALPVAGGEFVSWTLPSGTNIAPGYCGANPTCIFQMNGPVQVQALFNATPGSPLVVFRQGTAASQGSVTSNPAGINCTPSDAIDCTHQFPIGSTVTLSAFPPSGVTFGGWGVQGTSATLNCVGGNTSPTCTFVVPAAPLYITAQFNTQTFPMTVSVSGQGGVSSNIQPGISCGVNGTTCTFNFASGTQVSLNPDADAGYTFQGWGGVCTGTGACVVTMNAAQNVSATFVAAAVEASVTGNRVIYRNRNPRRVLQITVNSEQDNITVRVQLRRNGVTYASKTFRNVDEGVTRLALNIRNNVPAGRYTARVTLTNNLGAPPLVQNRNVRLKSAF